MSETTNYKLYITDDDTEKFRDWREKMNGIEDSNMVKIDAALEKKADSSVVVNATLSAAAWTGTTSPFTQDISVPGLTAVQNGTISVAHTATVEERDCAREAMLSVIGQESEKLIIAADGEMPELDIPVCIIMLG